MVHSHRCGVGAIVKFLLTDVSQRGGAAQQVSLSDWRESTGMPGPQWNTTKWRGQLQGRREGPRPNRGDKQTWIGTIRPEKRSTAPADGEDTVRGHEEFETFEFEVQLKDCTLCRGGDAPEANQNWFPRRNRRRGGGREAGNNAAAAPAPDGAAAAAAAAAPGGAAAPAAGGEQPLLRLTS